MTNTLRRKLQQKEKPLGTFVNQFGAAAVEIIARAGFDYVILDAEHGLFEVKELAELLRTADGCGIDALVRIPEPSREWILRSLDAGAAGLVIPNIRTIDEVQTVLRYAKYPPQGKRGFAPVRSAGYGTAGTATEIQAEANRNTLLFPQCETVEALAILDEILDFEGIDGLFVGPYDLSSAMGIIGQFDHPDLVQAITDIQKRCAHHKKHALIFSMDTAGAKKYLELGYDSVTVGLDYAVLLGAYQKVKTDMDA